MSDADSMHAHVTTEATACSLTTGMIALHLEFLQRVLEAIEFFADGAIA